MGKPFSILRSRYSRRRRKGAVLVLAAILMTVMFALLAFAVDIGYLLSARTELQRTADASALAAVMALPDPCQVTINAYRYVELNHPDEYSFSVLAPADIEIGTWDFGTASFAPVPFAETANAVRVTVRRSQAGQNPVSLFFAAVLGNSVADVTATATAYYDRGLCGPFVGIDWLSVPGSPTTDSYNSEDGSYSSATAGDKGSICSDGPINVDGAAVVNGDANPGNGYTTTITGHATVTGNMAPRMKGLRLPEVDVSSVATNNDNANLDDLPVDPLDDNGNFLLESTHELDLPPGTYYFADFTLSGQATLNINGPTVIYVTGDLYTGGLKLANNTELPNNLKIYMTGGNAEITGASDFHGVIYAPNTHVLLKGSASLFGAIVGRTLTLTGDTAAHFDESLDLNAELDLPKRVLLVQ